MCGSSPSCSSSPSAIASSIKRLPAARRSRPQSRLNKPSQPSTALLVLRKPGSLQPPPGAHGECRSGTGAGAGDLACSDYRSRGETDSRQSHQASRHPGGSTAQNAPTRGEGPGPAIHAESPAGRRSAVAGFNFVTTAVTTRVIRPSNERPRDAKSPAFAGLFECAQGDSNSHGPYGPQGPQPCASTNSATGACGSEL
jgi:hypothetical protein